MEKALEETFELLESRGYERERVAFVYLDGSRLYGINTETSDYDTVAFVLPTKDDLFTGKVLSKFLISEKENALVESVKLNDLRKVETFLHKFTLNSLPLLSEPLYQKEGMGGLLSFLRENAGKYARGSRRNFLLSVNGAMMSRDKRKVLVGGKGNSVLEFSNMLLSLGEKNEVDFGFFSKNKEFLSSLKTLRAETPENEVYEWTKTSKDFLHLEEDTPYENENLRKLLVDLVL